MSKILWNDSLMIKVYIFLWDATNNIAVKIMVITKKPIVSILRLV